MLNINIFSHLHDHFVVETRGSDKDDATRAAIKEKYQEITLLCRTVLLLEYIYTRFLIFYSKMCIALAAVYPHYKYGHGLRECAESIRSNST